MVFSQRKIMKEYLHSKKIIVLTFSTKGMKNTSFFINMDTGWYTRKHPRVRKLSAYYNARLSALFIVPTRVNYKRYFI